MRAFFYKRVEPIIDEVKVKTGLAASSLHLMKTWAPARVA